MKDKMKKINFTMLLFAILFILIAIFAAFNYSTIYMGDSDSSSMANGINNSGQIGGASDTSVMLAVAGADGEAADVSGEQSVTEESENSDQTAGNDDATQPFVWDNSLALLEMPPEYGPEGYSEPVGYSGPPAGGASFSGPPAGGGGTSPDDDYNWPIILSEDPADGYDPDEDELTLHHTPEPATILLFGSGLIGLGVFGRKKIKHS